METERKEEELFASEILSDKSIMYLSESQNYRQIQYPPIDSQDLFLLRVDEVCFEENAPKKEALENVLSAVCIEGIIFVFLIMGNKDDVGFYYGVAKDKTSDKKDILDLDEICDSILLRGIRGNFRGSKVTTVSPDEKQSIIRSIKGMKHAGLLEGVPGVNKDDEKYQSADRLADIMHGSNFAFMVLAKPLSLDMLLDMQRDLYRLYSSLMPFSKQTIQTGTSDSTGESQSYSEGKTETEGASQSTAEQNGKSDSTGKSVTQNTNDSKGTTLSSCGDNSSKGRSESTTVTKGHSDSVAKSQNIQTGSSTSHSESKNVSREHTNRELQDWIKYFDEILFPRLDYGKGKGTYAAVMAQFTDEMADMLKLQNTAVSLFAGERGNRVPLKAVSVAEGSDTDRAIRNFRLPFGRVPDLSRVNERLAHTAFSHVIRQDGNGYIGSWITTNELSIISGLPQKEIIGLRLKEEVEFGLNPRTDIPEEDRIELGSLVQSGNVTRYKKVFLDKKLLDQHIFIGGVTGSGKTTTCQQLLHSAGVPFLVIEPAKTEYRILKECYPDLLVFTLGRNTAAPLKMNPFALYPHESISSHVDMIKACIESAFDMEAAIPQIIESAIYKSYKDLGWNIDTNTNDRFGEEAFSPCSGAFPTLSELVANCQDIVRSQGFDERLRDEYIGSINARLNGLLAGGKGQLLNNRAGVDFTELLDKRVVFELEEVRGSGEKALIMGFILISLNEAIRARYLKKGSVRHITLVEEAHRLLSKYVPGDSLNKKNGVEMFTDMLAEIRKYGESLIIVDQIPNKLTPEVLKNTNTKIIHRLFAADDKDAVGSTIMLDKDQKEFLSNLDTGRAVFFSGGMQKAVQVQINRFLDTGRRAPADDELIPAALAFYAEHYGYDGFIPGSSLFREKPTVAQMAALKKMNDLRLGEMFVRFLLEDNLELVASAQQRMRNTLSECVESLGLQFVTKYILRYAAAGMVIEDEEGLLETTISVFLSDRFSSYNKLMLSSKFAKKTVT